MNTSSVQELKERVGHPLVDGRACITAMPEAFVRFVREHDEERLLLESPYRADSWEWGRAPLASHHSRSAAGTTRGATPLLRCREPPWTMRRRPCRA